MFKGFKTSLFSRDLILIDLVGGLLMVLFCLSCVFTLQGYFRWVFAFDLKNAYCLRFYSFIFWVCLFVVSVFI